MSELILWKKQGLDKLRKDLDLLFRRFRRGFGVPRTLLEAAESFSTEFSETEEMLVLSTDLPGIKPEDIEISVTEDTLNLKAEAIEDSVATEENFQKIEKRYRSFSRSISLPCRLAGSGRRAAEYCAPRFLWAAISRSTRKSARSPILLTSMKLQ